MPRRRLASKILAAAASSLMVFVGLGIWFGLGLPKESATRDRDGSQVRGVGEAAVGGLEPRPSSDGSTSRATPPSAGDLASEVPIVGVGECSISGIVLDPSDRPAAGAEVLLVAVELDDEVSSSDRAPRNADAVAARESLTRDFERRVARSPLDSVPAGGHYEFTGVVPGAFRVVARSAGFLPDVSSVVVVDRERPAGSVDLELERAESIRGVIMSSERSPIERARVDAERSEDSRRSIAPVSESTEELLELTLAQHSGAARSDARGRFEITGLPGGYYDLQITASGFARRDVADAPAREGSLQIILQPELFLSGEVVDRDGEPIPDAEVRLAYVAADAGDVEAIVRNTILESPDPGSVQRGRTDDEGRFKFGGLARGTYGVEVDRAGYLRASAPIVAVHESNTDAENFLVFELEDGHRIQGVIRSAGEEPLASARVRLRYLQSVPLDDEIRLQEEAAPSGVGAPRPEKEPAVGRSASSSRASPVGSTTHELARRIGQVHSALTNAEGAFDFPSLPEGLYRLDASATFHQSRTLFDVRTDGKALEVELEPGSPVAGRVVDRHSGEAVPRAAVAFQTAGKEGERGAEPMRTDRDRHDAGRAREVRTDAEGRFQIDSLPRGLHVARIEAEGYRALDVDAVNPHRESGVTFKLERSGAVSGRVHAGDGLSVEGLRVTLRPHGASLATPTDGSVPPRWNAALQRRRVARSSTTDVDGFYRVSVPAGGSYRVVVDGYPYAATSSRVLVIPDARAEIEGVDISVLLAGTVRGVILAASLGRVAGAQVQVVPIGPADETTSASRDPAWAGGAETLTDELGARTDATGEFTVDRLPGGSYRVVASAPGFIGARSESFDLNFGGTHFVELELEPEMTIEGIIVNGSGEPIPWAGIRAVVDGESSGEFWSNEHTLSSTLGTFRLNRLAPRPYDLRVTADEFSSALRESVPAGTDDVHVRLERLVSLSGRVVGAFTQDPVTEYRLRLQFEDAERLPESERHSIEKWREILDPDGAFAIDELPPGHYLVEIEASGHLEAEPVELELPVDEGLQDALIPLIEIGLIAGVVFDGNGRPVSGASVEAFQQLLDPVRGLYYRPVPSPPPESREGTRPAGGSAEGGERRGGRGSRGGGSPSQRPGRTSTKSDGSFVLAGLPDAVYRLSIVHDDYVSRDIGDYTVENGSGGDAAVGIQAGLASGVTLLGRVKGLAEVEGGGISVSLRAISRDPDARERRGLRRGSGRKSARVDESGLFEIRGLETGEYLLYARYRRAADGSSAAIREIVRIYDAHREKRINLDVSR